MSAQGTFEALIKDAFYDARNSGRTMDAAAVDAAAKVAERLTQPDVIDAFKVAWHQADEQNIPGSRVEHALRTLAEVLR